MIKALVGIIPVFLGFAVLAVWLFWKSKRFEGFGASVFSLFALMNGDAIFDVNHDLENSYYGVSQIFVYIFVSLSTLVILNVFIIIINDGYIESKTRGVDYWLRPPTSENQGKFKYIMYRTTKTNI